MRHLLPLLVLLSGPAVAQDQFSGEQLFGFHCASCHGIEATGNGPLGEMLTVRPPDLTKLSAENGGTFPLDRVVSRVDGTTEVKAHGGPMPVFGLILDGPSGIMAQPDGSDIAAPEALLSIAQWLMSVQSP